MAWLLGSARSTYWGEDAYINSVGERLERAQHPWLDLAPVQPAVAAPKGRDSDGCDAQVADHPGQGRVLSGRPAVAVSVCGSCRGSPAETDVTGRSRFGSIPSRARAQEGGWPLLAWGLFP